ncbi:MAG TPA: hypothetical protein VLB12_18480 [Gemmatimonadales bacterium]|nr:hypothetical protein [Gemmatimonadales bacterium]
MRLKATPKNSARHWRFQATLPRRGAERHRPTSITGTSLLPLDAVAVGERR